MTNRKIPKNEHARTRHDHASELAEDYVEAVADITEQRGACRVTDLAARFAVSHVSVNRAITRLRRDGFVLAERYGPVQLTPAGSRLARKARDRHETVFRFLCALGVSKRTAKSDAEGLEHHVSAETLRAMQAYTAQFERESA
jgi:DtxR family manganese transport transcriptional regulator